MANWIVWTIVSVVALAAVGFGTWFVFTRDDDDDKEKEPAKGEREDREPNNVSDLFIRSQPDFCLNRSGSGMENTTQSLPSQLLVAKTARSAEKRSTATTKELCNRTRVTRRTTPRSTPPSRASLTSRRTLASNL